MTATLGPLLSVVSRRPPTVQDRLLGIFVETLFEEFRTEITTMHITFASTLFGHRCDATVALQTLGIDKAIPLPSPRWPRFLFIVMSQKQLGQKARILLVIFGAAGDEGFAEFLESDGIVELRF